MRMYKTHKIHIALGLLALCVVFALLPVFGLAVDQEPCDGDHSGWTKLESVDQLESGGNYYLENDVDFSSVSLTANRISVKGNLNLCLNGHKLILGNNYLRCEGSSSASITVNICDCKDTGSIESSGTTNATVYIDEGNLNLWSGTIIGSKGGSSNIRGGGVCVRYNGVFNMYDGTITGGYANNGGGVLVYGTFNMRGGSIEHNNGYTNGGGVYVDSGSFNMYDGNISSNTAEQLSGGGIYASGAFYMENGTIANNDAAFTGGGIYLGSEGGTIKGGTIENNTAYSNGGGVYYVGKLYVSGQPVITGNTAGGSADNLYVYSSKITVDSPLTDGAYIGVSVNKTGAFTTAGCGEYAKYFHSDDDKYVVLADADGVLSIGEPPPHNHNICGETGCTHEGHDTEVAWTKLENVDQLKAGGNFYLAGDLDLSGALTSPGAIKISSELNLCLDGHKLTLGSNYLTSSGSTYNFGATINICDCAGTGSIESTESTKATIYMEYANLNLWSGTIIGSKNSSRGCGIYMYYGTFNMYGGTITGGEATYGGGGVYLGYGTFNMYGGSIEENTGGSKGGGGVYIGGGSTCTFNFYDGYIKNNTAGSATDGGGISAGAESVGLSNVNISGGYIIGNDAGRYGGGVYIGGGNFTMSGGTVEENTAGRYGGGIYMNRSANMSGKITIKGNTVQDAANNLYVGYNRTINVNGPLEAESYIGITMYTPRTFTGTGCGDYIDYFHSDDEGYYVVEGSGGALEIKSLLVVSFTGEGVTDSFVRLASGEKVSEPAPAPTRAGYTFIGWYDDYTGKWDFNTPVTRSMVLTATWIKDPVVTATGGIRMSYGDIGKGISVIYSQESGQEYNVQWQIKGTDGSWSNIEGASGKSYTIPSDKAVGTYTYRCVVTTSAYGSDVTAQKASGELTVKVKQREYSESSFSITGIDSEYDYTGTEIKPVPEVYFGETKLEEGEDYSLSYEDNKNAGGTGKITITFTGNFTGTAEKTFKVAVPPLPEGTSNEDVFTGYGDISSVWTTDKNGVIFETQNGWTVSETSDGEYGNSVKFTQEGENVKKTVYVKNGDTIYKTEISYSLDSAEPVVGTPVTSADGVTWTKDDIEVEFDVSDLTSGIESVTLERPGSDTPEALTPDGSENCSFIAESNGKYIVTIKDNAGNITTKEIEIGKIDKSVPNVTVSGGTAGEESLTFTVKVDGLGISGLDSIKVTNSSGSEISLTDEGAGTYTFTLDTNSQDGEYEIKVVTGAGVSVVEKITLYKISFDSAGGSVVAAQIVRATGKAARPAEPSRAGYTFLGWYTDSEVKWNFTDAVPSSSMTLTARWTINAPSSASMSAEGGKTEGTYDNGNTVVTLNASAPDPAEGITYTYKWYKDGALVEGQEGSTLELSEAGESGAYKVEIIAKDENGNESDPVSSGTIEVKIEKATPVITLGSFGEITYGDSLNDIAVPGTAQAGGRDVNGTFSWKDSPDTYPKANSDAEGGPAYGITFTPDDGDNYNEAETSTVLIVGKYIIDADSVTVFADDKTYDGTEEAEGTIEISGVANDGDLTATGTFTFEDKNAKENKTVYVENIVLDDQWTTNYELEATSKECKATISQRPVIIQWNYDGPFTYDGREKSVSADITNVAEGDSPYLTYENEKGTGAKTYNAKVTGVSDSNYTISGSENLELKWVINKAVFSYTVEENTFTYDGTAKTIEIVQNKGSQQPDCSFTILYDGEASQTDAGTYEAVITITNDNFTFADGKTTAEETLTIYKKNITGTWTGLDKVYDGNKANVGIILSGLAERDEGQEAVITSSTDMTSAGEHEVTATLKNYTITPGSATLKIQPKQVIFTVTDNAAASDGTAKYAEVSVDGLEKDKDFTVYYTDSKGNIVEEPTDAGTYEVWVKITNPDYSHVNGGDDVKVGSLVISKSPKLYQLSFDKNDEDGTVATGSMEPVSQPGGASVLLPECGYTRDGYTFAGWLYNNKVYQPGEMITMPSGDTSVKAQWVVKTSFSGKVKDESGNAKSDVVVSIWQGSDMLDQQITDPEGNFEFEDLAPGDYNIVVDNGGNKYTVAVTVSEDGSASEEEIVMPDNISTEVQVTPGSPEIVVDGLDGVFDKGDDIESVETVVSIGQTDLSQLDENTAGALEDLAGSSEIGLVIDMDITGTLGTTGGGSQTIEHASSQENLTIKIPLPADLQDKDSYKVVKVGTADGEGETLTTKPNESGEYYELSEDKTAIILYVKESGTYAVGSKNSAPKPTYPPIMEESENGSYTLNYPYPTYGQKVTIRPKPDEGYEVNTVTVLDSKGNVVEVTKNEDGTYSYIQPQSSVTIKVTFWKTSGVSDCPKDESCPISRYKDLTAGEWYHDGIHYCLEEGLMIGTSGDMFEPDAASSRAMVVTILWRMEGSPTAEGAMSFTDVEEGQWYTEAVNWATEKGIIIGNGDGTFGTENAITREEIAVIFYRYAQYKGHDVEVIGGDAMLNFADSNKISDWAVEAFKWACDTGLFKGDEGNLNPQADTKRSELATLIMRFSEQIEG